MVGQGHWQAGTEIGTDDQDCRARARACGPRMRAEHERGPARHSASRSGPPAERRNNGTATAWTTQASMQAPRIPSYPIDGLAAHDGIRPLPWSRAPGASRPGRVACR